MCLQPNLVVSTQFADNHSSKWMAQMT